MVTPARPPANGLVQTLRRIYNPIGFSRGYNFVLFFVLAGAMTGFSLARLPYLDYHGVFCGPKEPQGAMPGECYWVGHGYRMVGLWMHIATVLPAGLLVCLQFVPVIRHKAVLFHRINGYLVILLSILSTVGALMVTRHSFGGGTIDAQTASGLLSIMFLMSLLLGYINIKRLQLEEHRKWMLRAWVYVSRPLAPFASSVLHLAQLAQSPRSLLFTDYGLNSNTSQAGTIITSRIIGILMTTIVSAAGGYYVARPCAQIDFTFDGNQNMTLQHYPDCAAFYDGSDPDKYVVVSADFNGQVAEIGASLSSVFGGAMWLALAIHTIGVEVYLQLTPMEHERLRNISYVRQLEAGMKNPGSAGLTADRFGDAKKWVPESAGSRGDGEMQAKFGQADAASLCEGSSHAHSRE
ncbi:hypothetical protein ACRALDRAFT_1067205 [Sodiomyces alcalophilus JCM 7366]|uniref:uncharacterized protein n=1 Tax=Sodiomyces alcalophilus JCM 7366 TaxID=591952 RepID=UPI0039B4B9BE